MKKRITTFLCGIVALTLVVGTWAYYSSTTKVDNQLKTQKYGDELIEKFTPKENWSPGDEVTKEIGVKNTGNYDLFVRVKMSETWTLENATTLTIPSTDAKFITATATSATQTNLTDGLTAGDSSVVYKKGLVPADWTFNAADGYWYYNTKLTPTNSTGNLITAITLAGNADMGKYTTVNYHTTMATAPANNVVHATDPAQGWVVYTGAVPASTTFTRSVSQLGDPGYAGATYVLTITSETLQATQEAFTASTAWSTTPAGVKTSWGVS